MFTSPNVYCLCSETSWDYPQFVISLFPKIQDFLFPGFVIPVFRNMLEPFDPAEYEEEQGVTNNGSSTENPEENPEEREEEAFRPKTRAPPKQPSAEEVEKHMVTHLPFRDWCPHCVRGKSGSKPHRNTQGKHEIPLPGVVSQASSPSAVRCASGTGFAHPRWLGGRFGRERAYWIRTPSREAHRVAVRTKEDIGGLTCDKRLA